MYINIRCYRFSKVDVQESLCSHNSLRDKYDTIATKLNAARVKDYREEISQKCKMLNVLRVSGVF